MEERRLDPAKYDEDDRVLGNVELWWAKGLEAGRKIEEKAPSTIISYINKVLAQAQPQLGAVDSVFTHEQKVIVRFRKPALLEPKKIDERFVECLLYS